MNAAEDNNSFSLSPFDKQRILSMEEGETVAAENGLLSIVRYPKDYVLLFHSNQRNDMKEFNTPQEIFRFLAEFA